MQLMSLDLQKTAAVSTIYLRACNTLCKEPKRTIQWYIHTSQYFAAPVINFYLLLVIFLTLVRGEKSVISSGVFRQSDQVWENAPSE